MSTDKWADGRTDCQNAIITSIFFIPSKNILWKKKKNFNKFSITPTDSLTTKKIENHKSNSTKNENNNHFLSCAIHRMFNFHDRKGTYYQIELWTLIRFVCIHSLETPKALINIQSIFNVFFCFPLTTAPLQCQQHHRHIHNDSLW